jgi:hypothetical protein
MVKKSPPTKGKITTISVHTGLKKRVIVVRKKTKPLGEPRRIRANDATASTDVAPFVDSQGNVSCRFCEAKVSEHQYRAHLETTHGMHPAVAERWLNLPPTKQRSTWVVLVPGGNQAKTSTTVIYRHKQARTWVTHRGLTFCLAKQPA